MVHVVVQQHMIIWFGLQKQSSHFRQILWNMEF